jgi:hypothetical protein
VEKRQSDIIFAGATTFFGYQGRMMAARWKSNSAESRDLGKGTLMRATDRAVGAATEHEPVRMIHQATCTDVKGWEKQSEVCLYNIPKGQSGFTKDLGGCRCHNIERKRTMVENVRSIMIRCNSGASLS